MFKKISQKIGFTETEIKVILFLVAVFLTGYFYSTFYKDEPDTEYKNFDYSEQVLPVKEQGEWGRNLRFEI